MKIHVGNHGDSHWFRLVARNGRTVMTSETYATRSNALRAARKVSRDLGLEPPVERD